MVGILSVRSLRLGVFVGSFRWEFVTILLAR
jgi:hypothetical protein